MTSALNHFKESLVYETTTTVEGWRQDCVMLRGIDQRAERLRRQWLWTNILLGVVLLVCILIVPGSMDSLPRGFVGVVLGVPAVLLVGGILRYSTVKRLDVENRRYELVSALLDLLRRDMARDAQLFIRLDLLPATHQGKERKRFKSNGWDVIVYNDPWLTLRGRLQDGTRFSVNLRDHLQSRRQWRRSRSGKSKLKTKQKVGVSASLKLKVEDAVLPRLQAAVARSPQLQLPPGATMERLQLEEGAVVLNTYAEKPWTYEPTSDEDEVSALDLLALMFVGLYKLTGAPGAEARTP